MKKKLSLTATLVAAAASLVALTACAAPRSPNAATGIAVFGDWPYNQNLLANANLLIDSVNADPAVSLVMHVGDIHSGSMPCTSAGILPPIATANPGWNLDVFDTFQRFEAPMVYTPGDNEWTDCHKSKEGASGAPLNELAAVRQLFFSRPGVTLGQHPRKVLTQATSYNAAYPTDAQYVENVMWEDAGVVFATINMPGSNNDLDAWTGSFTDPAAQAQEQAQRNAADIRWLQAAFARAITTHAAGVVIGLQADMWDLSALEAGGDGLYGYTQFVQTLANLSVRFGRPVLLLNGDSHVYGADQPLADPNSATGQIHHTQPVPNLTRLTVQGSTNAPAEWLRLTIDPRDPKVFSWQNVAYCANPTGSCQ